MSKLSTLNDFIYIAGGPKLFKDKLRFLSLNYNGTIEKRKICYSPKVPQGSFNNPFQKSADIISIEKGFFRTTTEIFKELAAPLVSIFTLTVLLD